MDYREKMIDAGAKALRQKMQGSKRLNIWESLPNATKNKWRESSRVVLEASDPCDKLQADRKALLEALHFVQDHCTLYGASDAAREKIDAAIAQAEKEG